VLCQSSSYLSHGLIILQGVRNNNGRGGDQEGRRDSQKVGRESGRVQVDGQCCPKVGHRGDHGDRQGRCELAVDKVRDREIDETAGRALPANTTKTLATNNTMRVLYLGGYPPQF
jgi:hypothetical protein